MVPLTNEAGQPENLCGLIEYRVTYIGLRKVQIPLAGQLSDDLTPAPSSPEPWLLPLPWVQCLMHQGTRGKNVRVPHGLILYPFCSPSVCCFPVMWPQLTTQKIVQWVLPCAREKRERIWRPAGQPLARGPSAVNQRVCLSLSALVTTDSQGRAV